MPDLEMAWGILHGNQDVHDATTLALLRILQDHEIRLQQIEEAKLIEIARKLNAV